MKKLVSFSPIIWCTLFFAFLLCKILAAVFDYRLILYRPLLIFSITAGLQLISTIAMLVCKPPLNKTGQVFSAVLAPLSVFNGFLYLLASHFIIPVFILTLISCCCAVAVLCRFTKLAGLKITGIVLSSILFVIFLFCILFFSFMSETFGGLYYETEVKSLQSPGNTYVAEVFYQDEGALGGDWSVKVRRIDRNCNFVIGKLEKKPRKVYVGKFADEQDLRIAWADEHTLQICSESYPIYD